jgi:PhoPQ-activated pathogenicity-related protein
LPGEKLLRYVPNADHSLRRTDAFDTLKAFYGSILEDRPRPRLRWHFGSDGLLEVVSETRPLQAQLWQATNPEARDFRLETFGTNWSARPLTSEDGHFSVRIPEPDRGWTAALVELTYAGPLNTPFKLTTPVFVRPDRTLHRFVPDAPRGTR